MRRFFAPPSDLTARLPRALRVALLVRAGTSPTASPWGWLYACHPRPSPSRSPARESRDPIQLRHRGAGFTPAIPDPRRFPTAAPSPFASRPSPAAAPPPARHIHNTSAEPTPLSITQLRVGNRDLACFRRAAKPNRIGNTPRIDRFPNGNFSWIAPIYAHDPPLRKSSPWKGRGVA